MKKDHKNNKIEIKLLPAQYITKTIDMNYEHFSGIASPWARIEKIGYLQQGTTSNRSRNRPIATL